MGDARQERIDDTYLLCQLERGMDGSAMAACWGLVGP